MSTVSRIPRNLCIIGPPGSGKGSYGKLLAKSLNIPLISVSHLLKNANFDISSGKLLGDRVVNEVLVEHLVSLPRGYLLDGFPRTIRQVQWMKEKWPLELQIDAAICLEVPKEVCMTKMLGRRACLRCEGNWNVSDVHFGNFVLPPLLPDNCSKCEGEADWCTREDDVERVVEERLQIYDTMTGPILEHFEDQGTLLRFSPYLGYKDIPRFQNELKGWLSCLDQGEKINYQSKNARILLSGEMQGFPCRELHIGNSM